MTDIPEGLVEAVARALAPKERVCPDPDAKEDLATALWPLWVPQARAAILAQNAWQDDLNRRMVEFVEFRGENPRGGAV